MKFIFGLLLTALISPSLLASDDDLEAKYLAFGMGVTKCSEVNENFSSEKFQFVLKIWLTGYMTAVNSLLKEHPIGLSSSDIEDSINSLGSQCSDPTYEQTSIGEIAEAYWRTRVKEMAVKAIQ